RGRSAAGARVRARVTTLDHSSPHPAFGHPLPKGEGLALKTILQITPFWTAWSSQQPLLQEPPVPRPTGPPARGTANNSHTSTRCDDRISRNPDRRRVRRRCRV